MTPLPPPPPLSATPEPRARARRGRRFVAGSAALVGAGALLAVPAAALAQDDGDGWLSDTLQELVDEGTITSDQAGAVQDAIQEARPERGRIGPGLFGHGHGHGRGLALGLALDDAADALGIDVAELRERLRGGETIADVATDLGVDVQTVIDALVADVAARLDEAVADGRIDAEQAEQRLDGLTERVTRFVEEGFPGRAGCRDEEEKEATGEDSQTDAETDDSRPDDTTVTTDDTTVATEDTTVTTIDTD
jgi:polyhydroxyalkanoate synthesis regulator phasin